MNIDILIFQKINQLAFKWYWLDFSAVFFAKYFEYFLLSYLLLFLVISFKKYWLMVFQAVMAGVLARFFIVEIIRYIFPKDRPFMLEQSDFFVNSLLTHSPTNAFPSGHAAFYFAVSMVIFLYLKNQKPLLKNWQGISIFFFVSSFLISISRVFVGVHWPGDILAGAIIGILSGWFIFYLSQRFYSTGLKQSPQPE